WFHPSRLDGLFSRLLLLATLDDLRERSRLNAGAVAPRPHLRELRAQEEDLGGDVDPHQDDHERTGGPVDGADRALTQVESDQGAPHRKKEGGDYRPPDHVAPSDLRVGKDAADR